jgi:dolichol-phosphate mannosyltransferase
MTRPMLLSVVIPARNEEANIGATLDGIVDALSADEIPFELLVVDDGSSDDTFAVVEARGASTPGIRVVRNPGRNGFGRAIRYGLDNFTGDAVVIVMADASDDPADVVRYYYVLRDEAECAFGSRFIKGGETVDYPRFKYVINRLANLFIRILFRMTYNDATNAFKGYRANVVRGCAPIISPHFNLTVELPLKAIVRGYSYRVLPITWRNRTSGTSSLHLEEQGSRYLFIVLHVWLEQLLTKGDYRRPVEDDGFKPWDTQASDGAR